MEHLQHHIQDTVTFLKNRIDKSLSALVVLGSGLGDYANNLPGSKTVSYNTIPNFPHSHGHVQGHAGNLVFWESSPGFLVAFMQGRFHYYEGHSIQDVVYPHRVAKLLGAKTMLVTNAAGGIHPDFQPGDLMLITDHLNLMGANPLLGPNLAHLGPRFPDMSEAYNLKLRELMQSVAKEKGIPLQQGVYAALSGPAYETPAEIRMLKTLGADAVGMSTVPEVIAANHMGMTVVGLSCITNKAAGLSDQKLSHDEVMETGNAAKEKLSMLLSGYLAKLPQTIASPVLAES